MAEEGHKVQLHVYDLSNGLARQLSMSFQEWSPVLCCSRWTLLDPSSIEVFGTIYNHTCVTGMVDLVVTHVPKDVFGMYLQEIGLRYTAETYSLMTHICNNFSNEVAQFLAGASVLDYILNLYMVPNTSMGALIMPMIQNLEMTTRPGAVPQATQFRPSPVNTVPPTTKESRRHISKAVMSSRKRKTWSHLQLCQLENQKRNQYANDPLGDARSGVREEIGKKFAAMMASGTLRASEAAALATK